MIGYVQMTVRCKRDNEPQETRPTNHNDRASHSEVCISSPSARTLSRRSWNAHRLPQSGPVGKERSGLSLHVVLLLCQIELARDWTELCIGGRVEAVGCSCTCSEGSSGFAVSLLFGERADLAVDGLAFEHDKRVDSLDRLAVVRGEAEHMVQNNGAVRKRLGGDKQSLTKASLRVGCENLDKFRLDAARSDNYIAGGQSEDGLVGKDGEAVITWRGRGVELWVGRIRIKMARVSQREDHHGGIGEDSEERAYLLEKVE